MKQQIRQFPNFCGVQIARHFENRILLINNVFKNFLPVFDRKTYGFPQV